MNGVWVPASVRQHRSWRGNAQNVSDSGESNPFSIKDSTMIEQAGFVAHEYSVSPADFIPADEDLDDNRDPWDDYCYEARQVDRQRVLKCVLSSLDTDDSPLYALIDSALATPHEPGRARESITLLAQIGQALLDRVAASVDDLTNLRLAGRVA
jgi:hypothetical protein